MSQAPEPTPLEAALAHCESEPIHIPGSIQPFGIMLVLNAELTRVEQLSANAPAHFGLSPEQCLRASPGQLLPEALYKLARALLEQDSAQYQSARHHILAYRSDPFVVLEIEPRDGVRRPDGATGLELAFGRLLQQHDSTAVTRMLAQEVRRLTGFDRVMVYRFDPDWHGQVVAEARLDELPPLLGHHFPASDLPAQVRAMYLKNPLRLIHDIRQQPVALLGARPGLPAVDMSRGILRAVSPLHVQYLHNMGVAGSCSVALVHQGSLWGLVACHHGSALALAPARREALLQLVQFAGQRLFLVNAQQQLAYQQRLYQLREQLAHHVQRQHSRPGEVFRHCADDWLALLQSAGCAYLSGERRLCAGLVPEPASLHRLAGWLEQQFTPALPGRSSWFSDQLERDLPFALDSRHAFAGLLALPLTVDQAQPTDWLLFFRLEQEEIINWAGAPDKDLTRTEQGYRLNPRASFARWQQQVRGHSPVWQEQQLHAARDLAQDLAILAGSARMARLNRQLTEANQHLRHMAQYDALTGIWNRYRLEQSLTQEQFNAERYRRAFSVMLLDVDHFKRLNDNHGHNTGDHALRLLSQTIRRHLRRGDQFGRWGGEEFLLITPETPAEQALVLAERLRQVIAELRDPELPPFTVSIGVAQFKPGQDSTQLIDAADRALYRAKELGRNRCELAP